MPALGYGHAPRLASDTVTRHACFAGYAMRHVWLDTVAAGHAIFLIRHAAITLGSDTAHVPRSGPDTPRHAGLGYDHAATPGLDTVTLHAWSSDTGRATPGPDTVTPRFGSDTGR
ncbi:hypothetical protein CYMTET_24792 [Cymbomonas tetramitiformis]|uniref:Uncharacterized protein n=1 Tax=Cymbomonas tetramitiformis TaxID=36881 RepID=A0AAE0FV30_9CHLO|nr:hypothetical protein CYMTET_24792 [Cymbomonas tetramitiformis]